MLVLSIVTGLWMLVTVLLAVAVVGLKYTLASEVGQTGVELDIIRDRVKENGDSTKALYSHVQEITNKINDVRNRVILLDGDKADVKTVVVIDKKLAQLDGKGTVLPIGWCPETQGKLFKPGELEGQVDSSLLD